MPIAMPDPKHAGVPRYVTVGIFALAWLILSWPWLSGAVTIPWDAKSQFQPQVSFLAAALARGESPFWTPNVFAGWPQIADPQSLIFSPLHLLLAALDRTPSFRAVDAVTFVHLALGGLGIILYFRDRGWHPAGALVAAIAFAFGGAASSRLQHTGQVISLSYLPLTLWLLARALDRGSWRAGALAGLIGGLMTIGRDQVALIGLYVLAGFIAWHWFDGEKPLARLRASVRPLLAAGVAGLVVAVVPVAMSALLAAQSNRPEFGFVAAGRGSLHPGHFLTLAFPDLYGASDPTIDYWGPPSLPWSNVFGWPGLYLAQNMGQVYSGALVIVLVLGFGIIRGLAWERDIRFLTIATLVVLLYALGWYTPAFRLMYEVFPGVTFYRRPADAALVFGALLAMVAGYLVHRWLTGAPAPKRWQRGLETAVAAVVIALALTLAQMVDRLGVATIPITTGIAFASAAVGALALARRLAERSSVAAALLLAGFMTVDLAWNNAPNESTGLKPDVYEALRPDTRDETVALITARLAATAAPDRRDRVELTGIAYHWPNLALVHGFEHVFGHNPLRLQWFFAATRVGDTVAGADQRKFSPLFPSYRSPMADLFGLRFIVTGFPVGEIDSSLRPGDLDLIARTKDAYVYENPRALPRVMVLSDWRVTDFNALVGGGWPDVDPRRTVLLEHAPAGLPSASSGAMPVNAARIVRYANTDVIVEVDAPAGGILVLNDMWHPWWRAGIDGAAADILKANIIFRAVVVPPGTHTVRFTFHPFAGALKEIADKVRAGRR
ncbi:MAG: glycosyltransferase family 39 protein [Xanthobacteraceae bacterium]